MCCVQSYYASDVDGTCFPRLNAVKSEKDPVPPPSPQFAHAVNTANVETKDEFGWFNLNKLARHPLSLLRTELIHQQVPGVTDPMLCMLNFPFSLRFAHFSHSLRSLADIGTMFSTFSFHVEDNQLYSISFNHRGAPKTWFAHCACDLTEFHVG